MGFIPSLVFLNAGVAGDIHNSRYVLSRSWKLDWNPYSSSHTHTVGTQAAARPLLTLTTKNLHAEETPSLTNR